MLCAVNKLKHKNATPIPWADVLTQDIDPKNTGICLIDVDGFLERRGHLLLVEWKQPGDSFDRGQLIALNQAARHATVIIVYGNKPRVGSMELYMPDGRYRPPTMATNDDFTKVVQWWYARATDSPMAYWEAKLTGDFPC